MGGILSPRDRCVRNGGDQRSCTHLVDGLGRTVPGGRERRGRPGARRLPRPADGRAGPERRRCGGRAAVPGRVRFTLRDRARGPSPCRREHRRAAHRRGCRVARDAPRLGETRRRDDRGRPVRRRVRRGPRGDRRAGHPVPERRRPVLPRGPAALVGAVRPAVAGRSAEVRRRTGRYRRSGCRSRPTVNRRRASRRRPPPAPRRGSGRSGTPAARRGRRRAAARAAPARARSRSRSTVTSRTGGRFGRWHVQRAGGEFTADERERLLADRPTEERARPYWSVLWALPHDQETTVPRTVHAPTPTDEPLSLPACCSPRSRWIPRDGTSRTARSRTGW